MGQIVAVVKTCPHCLAVKPLTDFYPKHSWCKVCKNKQTAEARRVRTRSPRLWRPPFGERSHAAKLNNHDVRLIKMLLKDGLRCAVIAEKFEVSRQLISQIKHERIWTEVAG